MSHMFKLAFDKSTNRRTDVDGRLHVDRSNISKAQVSRYYGKEIPEYETLGLDGDKIYQLLRDPEELKKAAPTFNNLPILSEHVPVTADEHKPEIVIGSIGSDVEFNNPYLTASTCIWDSKAIDAINNDIMTEWSCAYRYKADMTPGEYEGNIYDGVMRDIQANHLALVDVGRAGSDVYVADSNPFNKDSIHMTMTKLGKALTVALQALSPKLANDAALPALVGKAKTSLDQATTTKDVVALDAGLSPETVTKIIGAIVDVGPEVLAGEDELPEVEKSPVALEPAEDEDKDDKDDKEPAEDAGNAALSAYLDSKGLSKDEIKKACGMATAPASDEAPEDEEKKIDKKVSAAMDGLRKEFKELNQAKKDVRDVVGDVEGVETASGVYSFALDHLTVKHAGVKDVVALRAIFNAANGAKKATPQIASDSGASVQFPLMNRFKQA